MTATNAPPIDSHRLDNGLTVLLVTDHRLPLVATNIWYHVGSKDERPGRTGFAHLFEHMLFQGSQHVDTNGHFAHVQRVGGVANGSTWYDRTNYYQTLPADHLELALWLESDRMGFLLPALTQEKLDTQKAVVINERRQRVDNAPYGRAAERVHELLYPDGHPYRWPVIGYTEDIEAATLDDVADFFRRFYAPANAVLTLVGDIDPDDALAQVERYFGDLPGGAHPTPPSPPDLATEPVREEMADHVSLAKATWARRVGGLGSDEWYRTAMLTEVLSGGRSAPLYRRLVQELEVAQSVGAYVMPTELGATFALQAYGTAGTPVEALEEAVRAELAALVHGGIPEAEVSRARNALLTSQFEELQGLDDRADAISLGQTFFGDPTFSFDEAGRLAAVSADDVGEAAAALLDLDLAVTVAVRPEDPTRTTSAAGVGQ